MSAARAKARHWSVIIAVVVVALAAVGTYVITHPTPSESFWRDRHTIHDIWRVLVNGFASANPDYAIDFLESRQEDAELSDQGGRLRLVLSPRPGQLGSDLRFETTSELLPGGSIRLPTLWSSRITVAYRRLAFKTEPVEDMLAGVRGPFWVTAVAWFERPLTPGEVEAAWHGDVEKVFFPPSKRGAEAPPITWSRTTWWKSPPCGGPQVECVVSGTRSPWFESQGDRRLSGRDRPDPQAIVTSHVKLSK